MGGSEPPSYLNRWQNLGKKVWDRQSNKANEAAGGSSFQREEPEASVFPSSFERCERSCTLLARTDLSLADPAHDL